MRCGPVIIAWTLLTRSQEAGTAIGGASWRDLARRRRSDTDGREGTSDQEAVLAAVRARDRATPRQGHPSNGCRRDWRRERARLRRELGC